MSAHARLALPVTLAGLLFSLAPLADARAATSVYSDLYGAHCRALPTEPGNGTRTRRCAGVAGYGLLIHEADATTSVDIVSPRGAHWPLDYWEVVTPGLARVGRKAEWRMELRHGQLVPVALLMRLDTANPRSNGPRMAAGAILVGARIARDGACVVYRGNGATRSADEQARSAVARARRCLGVLDAPGER